MAREKKKMPSAVARGPQERHKRKNRVPLIDRPVPPGFVAKPAIPKSKHQTYFEFVENKNKKKPLEFQETTDLEPPPGFEFVPIGNPQLTTACKELSREKGAMIFIVSSKLQHGDPQHLSHHIYRLGHHIRAMIVDEVKSTLAHLPYQNSHATNREAEIPEPLPDSQAVYSAQVNAALLDLFPRIPHTARQAIIERTFNLALRKTVKSDAEPPVGLCETITLSRRVQLAVLAHIRHSETRYDELLRETSWANARKVVENLCLDTLVKWRGDDETGRDQLDEILREVVIISDTEGDSDDEGETDESSVEDTMAIDRPGPSNSQQVPSNQILEPLNPEPRSSRQEKDTKKKVHSRKESKKEQRGFKRYRAWEKAIQRNRGEQLLPQHLDVDGSVSNRPAQTHAAPEKMPDQRDAMGAVGVMPLANGFVPQQTQRPGPHPAPYFGAHPSSFMSLNTQVMSSAHEQAPRRNPSRNVSPVANPLQDMLVRSIEPASPDNTMQPSFVRALPPRTQLSPYFQSGHRRLDVISPLQESRDRGGMFYDERRVLRERQPQATGYHVDSPINTIASRDYYSMQSQDQSMPTVRAHSTLSERQAHNAHPASSSSARTILVDAGRPGERSNPILMEDRGGFYERIPAPSGNRSNPILMEDRGGFYERVYVPAGSQDPRAMNGDARNSHLEQSRRHEAHRVVSWEEGSRILRESRDNRGVEVIPLSAVPLEMRSHVQPAPAQQQLQPFRIEGLARSMCAERGYGQPFTPRGEYSGPQRPQCPAAEYIGGFVQQPRQHQQPLNGQFGHPEEGYARLPPRRESNIIVLD